MKLIPLRRCPYCGSIWVCWNWIHAPAQWTYDTEDGFEYNEGDIWVHECWNCEGCFETPIKIYLGIPYKILRFYFEYVDTDSKMGKMLKEIKNMMLKIGKTS